MKRQSIKIGLFGFGCVGTGLYEVLEKTPGFRADIVKICVKDRAKERSLPASRFTFDPLDILDDAEINTVVELIDDADAAWLLVSAALKKGKAVVSANKKMIAEHFSELLELQRTCDVPFLYEASCCASIPIIRNLEEYYDNDMLRDLTGIVNGSTNFILTSCIDGGRPFGEALAEAQRRGYAETDPALDVEGFDAKYKLTILLAHAFGAVVKPEHVFHEGITRIAEPEIRYAKEKGWKIKLLAQASRNSIEQLNAFVIPSFIRPNHQLFYVDDVFNGIVTETAFADRQVFVGKGAGAHPTASAVLSDISALSYNYRYEFKKIGQQTQPYSTIFSTGIYLRWNGQNLTRIKELFTEIQEENISKDRYVICGQMGVNRLEEVKALAGSDHCVIGLN